MTYGSHTATAGLGREITINESRETKMPSAETVNELIAMVEAGDFVASMERFYADDATAQENQAAPREGLPALIANEKGVLKTFTSVRGRADGPPLINGDKVVIHWLFEFETPLFTLKLDELALQTWEGEKLKSERFYYDPSQMAPPSR